MTTYDPELVEKVACDLYEKIEVSYNGIEALWIYAGRFKQDTYRRLANLALAAIDASGTHSVKKNNP